MSHHISGPRAMAEPIADITDLYAFPSPEHPGRLVLVLNTLPFAPPSAVFSEGLIYRFRLRPLTASDRDDGAPFAVGGEEIMIDCVFSAPAGGPGADGPGQAGTCATPAGERVSIRVNDEHDGQARGVRVFAGPRWDPFIMDAPATLKTIATGKLAFTDPGAIYLDGKNVLSLVVEVDRAGLQHHQDFRPAQPLADFAVKRCAVASHQRFRDDDEIGRPVDGLLIGPIEARRLVSLVLVMQHELQSRANDLVLVDHEDSLVVDGFVALDANLHSIPRFLRRP